MRRVRPLLLAWLLAGCSLFSACDGTDVVSLTTPRDASPSVPPEGAPARDAGRGSFDAGDAAPDPLDASTGDTGADGGDAAPETREQFCARKDREFLSFVEENRGCRVDAD